MRSESHKVRCFHCECKHEEAAKLYVISVSNDFLHPFVVLHSGLGSIDFQPIVVIVCGARPGLTC